MRISVQLARTKEEYEQAFRLLKRGAEPDYEGDLWVLKQHALPSSNTIIALKEGTVVGALTLFGESAFRLPLEEKTDLSSFRESLTGRIAELSHGAADSGGHERDVLLALYHFALCFGSTYCYYDAFVTCAGPAWIKEFGSPLQFQPLPGSRILPGQALFRNVREGKDLRQEFSPGFEADFIFPEKKFFLVAHQSIDAESLNYLFNEKTKLFSRLSDLELRVLKNFYDHGAFALVLPDRALKLPYKALPKHRRFPMNCDGFLKDAKGSRVNLQVLDVSREGIKVRSEELLAEGVYPLTLSVGVMKQAEVIASTIWTDEFTQISGLMVKSGDTHWKQLIEYLERECLKVAA